jgi:hypothetical protein
MTTHLVVITSVLATASLYSQEAVGTKSLGIQIKGIKLTLTRLLCPEIQHGFDFGKQ